MAGTVIHLEPPRHGEAGACVLGSAPGLPSIDCPPVARCIRLDPPGRPEAPPAL